MKRKKLLAMILTFAVAATMTAMPSAAAIGLPNPLDSAGSIITPAQAGTPSYEINIRGVLPVNNNMEVPMSTVITLDSMLLPSGSSAKSNTFLRSTAQGGVAYAISEIKDVRFGETDENSRSTSTRVTGTGGTITYSDDPYLAAVDNVLRPGTNISPYKREYFWTATLVLDATRRTQTLSALGLSTATNGVRIENQNRGVPEVGFGSPFSSTYPMWDFTITSAPNVAVSSYPTNGQDILTRNVYGNGTRVHYNNALAIRNAANFDVILHFNETVTNANVYTFSTNLSRNLSPESRRQVTANTSGTRNNYLTFANVSKEFFFNTALYNSNPNLAVEDYIFTSMRINGPENIKVTRIEIFYWGTNYPDPGGGGGGGVDPGGGGGGGGNTPAYGDDPAVPEPELILNFNAITLMVGAGTTMTRPRIVAEGYTTAELIFTIMAPAKNGDVITLYSSGAIQAMSKPGTVTILVRDRGTRRQTSTVQVNVIERTSRPITTFTFSGTGGTVRVGGTYNFLATNNATIAPSNHNDVIQWFSSDRNIATVDSAGRVSVRATGKFTITGITQSGIMQTRTLTALHSEIVFPGNVSSAAIKIGEIYSIGATMKAPGGTSLSYSSTNEAVAKVDPVTGRVVGISQGRATINVRVMNRSGRALATRNFNVTVS
ncbi:MAG: Ig-like domain-containing protein [Oscillospiraceae bacterium]|nr:Ig-like domain-containing protein [Oscillospiraceae bacterium]